MPFLELPSRVPLFQTPEFPIQTSEPTSSAYMGRFPMTVLLRADWGTLVVTQKQLCGAGCGEVLVCGLGVAHSLVWEAPQIVGRQEKSGVWGTEGRSCPLPVFPGDAREAEKSTLQPGLLNRDEGRRRGDHVLGNSCAWLELLHIYPGPPFGLLQAHRCSRQPAEVCGCDSLCINMTLGGGWERTSPQSSKQRDLPKKEPGAQYEEVSHGPLYLCPLPLWQSTERMVKDF